MSDRSNFTPIYFALFATAIVTDILSPRFVLLTCKHVPQNNLERGTRIHLPTVFVASLLQRKSSVFWFFHYKVKCVFSALLSDRRTKRNDSNGTHYSARRPSASNTAQKEGFIVCSSNKKILQS